MPSNRSNRKASVAKATQPSKTLVKKKSMKKSASGRNTRQSKALQSTTEIPVDTALPQTPERDILKSPVQPVESSPVVVPNTTLLPVDSKDMVNEYGSNHKSAGQSPVIELNDIPVDMSFTRKKEEPQLSAVERIQKDINQRQEELTTCVEFWSILRSRRPKSQRLTEDQMKQDHEYRASIRSIQADIRELKSTLAILQDEAPQPLKHVSQTNHGKYQAKYYTYKTGQKTDAEPVPFVDKFENASEANGLSDQQLQPVFLNLMHHTLMRTMKETFDKKATQLVRPLKWSELKKEFLQSTVAHSLKDQYVLDLQKFRRNRNESVFNMGSRFRSAVRLTEMQPTDNYVHSLFLTHLGGSVKGSTSAFRDELQQRKEEVTLDKLIDKAIQWEDSTNIIMPIYPGDNPTGKYYCNICKKRGDHKTRKCPSKNKGQKPYNNDNGNISNNNYSYNKRRNNSNYQNSNKKVRFSNNNNNNNNNNNGNNGNENLLFTISDVTKLLNTVQSQPTNNQRTKYCNICKKTNHNTNEHKSRKPTVNNITPQQQAILNMLASNTNTTNLN